VSSGPSAATATLNHSRVLVTKFHQNRSTLKGRSAGQRERERERERERDTHTYTDKETERQTRLKIRALQVCNRANNETMTIFLIISFTNSNCNSYILCFIRKDDTKLMAVTLSILNQLLKFIH